MESKILDLVGIFAPLSFATIGGGQGIIASVQHQVVDVHLWLTASQFLALFAISRMAPGPGSLLVTLIGWYVAGPWGAFVATLALFVPTSALMYGVAHLWSRHKGARWQVALERGLRPVAAGLIIATASVLLRSLEGGWLAIVVAGLSTLVLITTGVSVVLVIACGMAIFVAASQFSLIG
jgi:chromate transporter